MKASNPARFATHRLQLAIALHATGSLKYSHCELIAPKRANFVFDDPEHRGTALELEYSNGRMNASCLSLFASQTFLRQQLSEAIDGGRNGNR